MLTYAMVRLIESDGRSVSTPSSHASESSLTPRIAREDPAMTASSASSISVGKGPGGAVPREAMKQPREGMGRRMCGGVCTLSRSPSPTLSLSLSLSLSLFISLSSLSRGLSPLSFFHLLSPFLGELTTPSLSVCLALSRCWSSNHYARRRDRWRVGKFSGS
eukprot:scaffold23078_cov32-Tisochrysis_lutea.AAC.5